MKTYYGIDNYLTVQDPTGLYIEHIDTWAKFISPTKLLIRSVNETNPRYSLLENVVNTFKLQFPNVKIDRIYAPNGEPYTNSFIINRHVYVPIMKGKFDHLDSLAIEKYKQVMGSGYTVVGVLGNKQRPWLTTDALHCRIIGIPCLKDSLNPKLRC
jgi:agmatine deiminase